MNTPQKVCIYRLTDDHGLAPNPFHNVCTLAVCTPNHKRANLKKDDIIIGFAGLELKKKYNMDGERIIYCMQITEVMDLDTYYHSREYEDKKPSLSKGGIYAKGDNFYYRNEGGQLCHSNETDMHDWDEVIRKDIYGDRVFISKNFLYFGRSAIKVPSDTEWSNKLQVKVSRDLTQGIQYIYGGNGKVNWDDSDIRGFLDWFTDYQGKGLIDMPLQFKDEYQQ